LFALFFCLLYNIYMKKERVLFLDIETAPSLGYFYNMYSEGNILKKIEDWYIISIAWKWQGEKKVNVLANDDFGDIHNDNNLMIKIGELLDEADIVIAHNGDSFDIKKINARLLVNGIKPPSPYKTIDTKKVAKKYFKFDSNSLDNLANDLGMEGKMDTPKNLFIKCIEGDMKMWKIMKKYNKQDVVVLEEVYNRLSPWITNHPSITMRPGECKNCHSHNYQLRGFAHRKNKPNAIQRIQCNDCGSWGTL